MSLDTTSKTALASVFGMSNFALVWYTDGYFAPRAEFNPFTHTWSLAVEEQFYLIFPLMFFAWARHCTRTGAMASAGRWLIPMTLLASLAYCAYETQARPDLAYYMLPSRFWELACGAMLFRFHHAGLCMPRSPRQSGLWMAAGGALIALTFAVADTKSFPFPWAVPAVLGATLVICGSVGDVARRSLPSAFLGSRPMTYIGKISYSLYLWHWPVLVLLRWTIGIEHPATLALAATLAFALAIFSYHQVEQGAWWRRKISGWPTDRTAVYGLAGVLLCALCLSAVLKFQQQISLSVTRDRQTWYPNAWPSAAGQQTPSTGVFADRKIFVWGDSHAGAYATMLQMLKEQTGAKVITYSRAGCAIAGLRAPVSSICQTRIAETVAEIKKQAVEGDIVFLASLRVPRLADQWAVFSTPSVVPTTSSPSLDERRLKAVEEAGALVETFERAGLRVIIDAPKPIFKTPPFRCSDAFNAQNPICANGFALDRAFLEQHRQPTMQALALLKASHPGISVWDPFPVLCPGATCSAFDASKPLFFDGDHLSAHGNRVLYPSFLKLLAASMETNLAHSR